MAEIRSVQPTVQSVVEGAIRLFGGIAREQSATPAELADVLNRLNDMIESWNLQKPLIYEISREAFTLTPNKNPHTIGLATGSSPAGDLATPRPPKIQSASIMSGRTELPITILSDSQFQGISTKSTTTSYPTDLWYEREWPLGKIWLYPEPGTAHSLILNLWKQLDSGLELADRFNVPPGYLRAIRYNLAVEIAVEWGQAPSRDVSRIAKEAKAAISISNADKPSYMRSDAAFTGIGSDSGYQIFRGGYFR